MFLSFVQKRGERYEDQKWLCPAFLLCIVVVIVIVFLKWAAERQTSFL